jgi:hypothetical protein
MFFEVSGHFPNVSVKKLARQPKPPVKKYIEPGSRLVVGPEGGGKL